MMNESTVMGREKHLCILDEMNRLEVEINLLSDFGDRISVGNSEERVDSPPSQDISLLEFLEQASGMIANLSSRLVSFRASLTTLLFLSLIHI